MYSQGVSHVVVSSMYNIHVLLSLVDLMLFLVDLMLSLVDLMLFCNTNNTNIYHHGTGRASNVTTDLTAVN